MLNFCEVVVAILKVATGRNFSISGINSGLLTLKNFYRSPFLKWPPQYRKIQHCAISSQFDMWVDNDVPNLFSTLIVMKSDNVEFL
jgi:hypothetical protein